MNPEILSRDMMIDVREGEAPNPNDGLVKLASKLGFPACRKIGMYVLYKFPQRLKAIPDTSMTRMSFQYSFFISASPIVDLLNRKIAAVAENRRRVHKNGIFKKKAIS
jgi:hypothetical protein